MRYVLLTLIVFRFNDYVKANTKGVIFIDSIRTSKNSYPTPNSGLSLGSAEKDLFIFFKTVNPTDTIYYQLVEFDANSIVSLYPIARYTNLKGKNYTLLFWSSSDRQPRSLDVYIKPTLLEEWWFLPAVGLYLILMAGAIVYFWTMYNFRQRMKVESMRNQIAGDLHDEVGSTLGSIAIFTKVLRRNFEKSAPEALPVLDRISVSSQETIDNLRDTVWAINPINDDAAQLIEKMRSFAYQILTAKEIKVEFVNEFDGRPHLVKNLKIGMQTRRNVYLMFKEAVHNIVKHSECKSVNITLAKHKEGLILTVKDDGKGFDTTEKYQGNGLNNFHKRAEESFITLKISSTVGKGTLIEMLVPEL